MRLPSGGKKVEYFQKNEEDMGQTKLDLKREQHASMARPRYEYSLAARCFFLAMDLVTSRKTTLAKTKLLEMLASIPYREWETRQYGRMTQGYRNLAVVQDTRRSGEKAKEEGQAAYRKLIRVAETTIGQAQKVLPWLREQVACQDKKLAQTLETFTPKAQQVVSQTIRRVLQQEKVPASEKIVSIFEAHSDIIQRNKAHKPTEYGHKVWLDEVDGGIVTRWDILDGNPNDDRQWLPSLEHHIKLFGKAPQQASADRGVHSSENERLAQQRGIRHVILPQPGRRSEERLKYERQSWFKRGRKWHNGVEGRISVLKRRFELNRCRDHGEVGFDKWVGWGVIVANLKTISRKVAAQT
jgi:IS5 family transposase